jgi:hypothetical protein
MNKLEDYARVCDRCGEGFRSKSKTSKICYGCSKNKKRSVAVVED